MNRGALVCTEGVNRRLQIFVTVFNSQRSQTNTVLIRQPATTPRLPQHPAGAEPRCSADGDHGRADKAGLRAAAGSHRPGHPRVGAARARPGGSPQPRSLRPDEGSVSVFIISAPPLGSGSGGWEGGCGRTGGMCEMGWKKSSLGGSASHPDSSLLLRLYFFFPSDFVLLKHTSLPRKIPSP